MKLPYDTYYQTEHLFGEACPELIEYFKNKSYRGSVLDLGCGQGRDAIAIGRLGYELLGIDKSQVGIDQMLSIGLNEGLPVEGELGDLFLFDEHGEFDIILLDSIFHFLKRDRQKEQDLLKRVSKI